MWSVYVNHPEKLVDIAYEGENPKGAVGSNWQPGFNQDEAEDVLTDYRSRGYVVGHNHNSRF